MKLYFDDAEFDGQLQRTAAAAYSGSRPTSARCWSRRRKVTPGDNDSWFDGLVGAGRAGRGARRRTAPPAGIASSAADAWLRATEYWRQAIFFIRHDLDDARLQERLAAAPRRVPGGAAAPPVCHDHRRTAVRRRRR